MRDARHVRLVDIRVENLVHKANTGALVRVLLRQLDMNLPYTAFISRYNQAGQIGQRQDVIQAKIWMQKPVIEREEYARTLFGTMKQHMKFAHTIVHERDIKIRHQPI